MYEPIIKKHELIFLEESTHTYNLINSKIIFNSVTEFIGTFFEPFHEIEVAKKLIKMTKYSNKTVEDILDEWKGRRDRGTLVHKQIENFLVNKKETHQINDQKTKQGIDFLIKRCIKNDNHLFPEVRICSENLKLAGTIDLLIYNKIKKKFSIIDWKTNVEIKKTGYKKGINHPALVIDDCSFNKYSLQLSIYKAILEKEYNVEVAGLYIAHLKDSSCELIECRINQSYVKDMLNTRKQ